MTVDIMACLHTSTKYPASGYFQGSQKSESSVDYVQLEA